MTSRSWQPPVVRVFRRVPAQRPIRPWAPDIGFVSSGVWPRPEPEASRVEIEEDRDLEVRADTAPLQRPKCDVVFRVVLRDYNRTANGAKLGEPLDDGDLARHRVGGWLRQSPVIIQQAKAVDLRAD
jgi:hypothetical protein